MQQLAAAAMFDVDEACSLGISELRTRAAADVEAPHR
jgi:hypothetical protein